LDDPIGSDGEDPVDFGLGNFQMHALSAHEIFVLFNHLLEGAMGLVVNDQPTFQTAIDSLRTAAETGAIPNKATVIPF